jgi:hypothetical protein
VAHSARNMRTRGSSFYDPSFDIIYLIYHHVAWLSTSILV